MKALGRFIQLTPDSVKTIDGLIEKGYYIAREIKLESGLTSPPQYNIYLEILKDINRIEDSKQLNG